MGRYYAASKRHARRECIGTPTTARTRLQFPPDRLRPLAAGGRLVADAATRLDMGCGTDGCTAEYTSTPLSSAGCVWASRHHGIGMSTLEAIQYSILQCSAVEWSGVQYSTVQCSAVQCSACAVLCCAVLRCASSAGQVLTHSPVVLSSAPSLAFPSPHSHPPRSSCTHSPAHARTPALTHARTDRRQHLSALFH
jgi:hypothetical protein